MIATPFGGDLVWSFATQFEVLEGVVAVAALLPLAFLVESRGLGPRLDSFVVTRSLRSRLSPLFAFLGAGGALSFALLVLCNSRKVNRVLDVRGVNIVQYPLTLLGFIGGSALGQNGSQGYGALALVTWVLTLGALSVAMGTARAWRFFALPSVLFLTVVVLLFAPVEMDSQAINLVSSFTFDGVSLLSNWFLLTVSLFFTAYGLAHGRLGPSRRPETSLARSG
ncbi:MAG: hypothetical protein OK442_00590 [Thaumarchaeota archaeon]|nr:hypothetical protein [Nitrososphaerota archaeon]